MFVQQEDVSSDIELSLSEVIVFCLNIGVLLPHICENHPCSLHQIQEIPGQRTQQRFTCRVYSNRTTELCGWKKGLDRLLTPRIQGDILEALVIRRQATSIVRH